MKKDIIGRVFNIQRYSIHDGMGIRTIVFLKGCPLSCVWCSNPESQSKSPQILFNETKCLHCNSCTAHCPKGAIFEREGIKLIDYQCNLCKICLNVCHADGLSLVGENKTVEQVMEQVRKDRAFYGDSQGGLTLSGGEPALQWEFCEALLDACAEEGINTAMETCGYANWETFGRLVSRVDTLLYDIKHTDPQKHRELTGVDNTIILENAKRAAKLAKKMIVRIPVIPICNGNPREIEKIADFIATLKKVEEIHLLPYHAFGRGKYKELGRIYKMGEVEPPSRGFMEELAQKIRRKNFRVQIGG